MRRKEILKIILVMGASLLLSSCEPFNIGLNDLSIPFELTADNGSIADTTPEPMMTETETPVVPLLSDAETEAMESIMVNLPEEWSIEWLDGAWRVVDKETMDITVAKLAWNEVEEGYGLVIDLDGEEVEILLFNDELDISETQVVGGWSLAVIERVGVAEEPLYVLDEENKWKKIEEGESFEFSANFTPVWSESYVVEVGGIELPISIGLS